MIWKVLRTNIKITQLSAAFAGVLCGLTLLMGSVLFYLDIRQIFTDREGFWRDEYIVINKNIHLSDSYHQIRDEPGLGETSFSEEEIKEIKSLEFVNDVAIFTASTFNVRVYTDRDSPLPGFYSDLFFEAVPDKYIDVNYDDWKWEEGMDFVPTILPRAYLNLYNFGFAQSQGLPQVSEHGAGIIKFNVMISGNNKTEVFESRIIGFSDRINTFLVPLSFVEWGNKKFGLYEAPKPGRLIVLTHDPSNPELMNFFEEKDYSVSKSLLSNVKALAFLNTVTAIVLSIGTIIIVLAFWLMILSIMLLLERNKENISKLGLLGYSIKEISKPYKILVSILLGSVSIISLLPVLFFKYIYTSVIESIGYNFSINYFGIVLFSTLTLVAFFIFYLIIYINRKIKIIIIE